MGTPNTIDAVDVVAAESLLTAEELAGLDGIYGENGAHPSRLFGADWGKKDAPPHVKSYAIVGNALSGQPLDSWARWGVHDEMRMKQGFQNFSAITEGLSLDERVRFAVILIQYLKDISKMSNLRNNIFELETLAYARGWVGMLLYTVDSETQLELSKIDVTFRQHFPVPAPAPAETVEDSQIGRSMTEAVVPAQDGMRKRFEELFRGTILEGLFS